MIISERLKGCLFVLRAICLISLMFNVQSLFDNNIWKHITVQCCSCSELDNWPFRNNNFSIVRRNNAVTRICVSA